MTREPVVAVDFLGLAKSVRDRELELKSEERGSSMKPSGPLSAGRERSFSGDDDLDSSRPRLGLGTGSSHLSGSLTISLAQATPWSDNEKETERRGPIGSASEEKRVEELTDAEIMELTGEECRRYMMNIKKERARTGLSAAKTRSRMETRPEEEKNVSKRGGSSSKSARLEASSLAAPSGPELQKDGSPSDSGVRHVLPGPWHSAQSQASVAEDGHGGVGPSERAQPSGFGSPLPNYLGIARTIEHSQRPVLASQSGPGSGAQLGAISRSTSQTHLPGRPPAAQLTIFYSGMVNVYDNVPSDKAQAIMLLAGSGSSWSSSTMNPPPSVSVLPSTGGMASSSNSPARSGPAPAVAAVSQAGPVTSPLVPAISVAAGLKQAAGRPALHAELPQARKASLARFLEKRKDRVRGKAPYMPPIFSVKRDVGSSTPPREKSPSPINGNVSTRSPSPKVVAGSTNRSSSPAQRPGQSQIIGNETASPKTQHPVLQQGPQHSSSENQAPVTAAQRSASEGPIDWRFHQRSHLAAQDQKQEGAEEDKVKGPQRH